MLFSTTTRSLASKSTALAHLWHTPRQVIQRNARLMSSVSPLEKPTPSQPFSAASYTRREIHSDPPRLQYAASPTYYPEGSTARLPPAQEDTAPISPGMVDRFKITAEVTVSKIFPAGFGWQSSSIVAEDYLGYAPDSVAFALTTGLGDAIGVMAGHCAYFAVKKQLVDDPDSINMERESQTGLLLASAAFCSGTAWQPLVDALQAAELSFGQVFAGTWLGCGTAFYLGLRGARTILSGPCRYVHEPTYENSTTDKSLSVAIGGATGFFVGSDTAYLPAQNFLIDAVGIHDATPALAGCAIAGTSTSLGFLTAQSMLNAIYPVGKLWNDAK
jgi:hypothetical protein